MPESSFDEAVEVLSPFVKEAVNGSTTAILTMCIPATLEYLQICAAAKENTLAYVTRHGYSWLVVDDLPPIEEREGPSGAWLKIPLVGAALAKGYTHVFWKDSDSLFMSLSVSLESLLESASHQLAVSSDHGNLTGPCSPTSVLAPLLRAPPLRSLTSLTFEPRDDQLPWPTRATSC